MMYGEEVPIFEIKDIKDFQNFLKFIHKIELKCPSRAAIVSISFNLFNSVPLRGMNDEGVQMRQW